MVTINIEKKHLFLIIAISVFLAGTVLVISYDYEDPIRNPGHGADTVWIDIHGEEKTLQNAIDDNNFGKWRWDEDYTIHSHTQSSNWQILSNWTISDLTPGNKLFSDLRAIVTYWCDGCFRYNASIRFRFNDEILSDKSVLINGNQYDYTIRTLGLASIDSSEGTLYLEAKTGTSGGSEHDTHFQHKEHTFITQELKQ